jgi:hypothetical protein
MNQCFGIRIRIKLALMDPDAIPMKLAKTFCGPALVSILIRIQLLISTRIRIQGAKLMRINSDPDSGQTLKSQKVDFLHEKYT